MSPAQNATFSYYSQPITLVVTPGVTATGAVPTTVLEVAMDAAFASIVSTQTLPPAVNGQATATLNHLSAATTYYWRVKTTAGDNPSILSATSTFSIGPQLVIQPPTTVTPLATTFPHKRPTFTVTNAVRKGPPAVVTYRFDVATDATFQTVVATGTVPEGPMQTSFVPNVDLVPATSYAWRAQASDTAKEVSSEYSATQAFAIVNPDDGLWRYLLSLHLVSAVCHAAVVPPLRDVSFDNGLTVSGDHLQYALPSSWGFDYLLKLEVNRTGSQFSGTFGSNPNSAELMMWPGAAHFGIYIFRDVVSGTVDNTAGRFTGIYRGTFSDEGFPSHYQCEGEIAVTLTPH